MTTAMALENMTTMTSLQNLLDNFLSRADGKYEWKFEGFTGYTLHRNGKIVWAEGLGTMNKYHGISALLRIASNPQVEIEPVAENGDESPNVREDWDYVTFKLREQIRMTIRYFSLKPRKDVLWARRMGVVPLDIDATQAAILEKISDTLAPFPKIMEMNGDVLLWQLVVLEEKGALRIVEPQRVDITKKAD